MTLLDLVSKHGLDPMPTTSGELMLICPICQDHKARLYINMTTGLWLCFHCEERGNIYTFCREVLELDHFEARHAMDRLDLGVAAATALMTTAAQEEQEAVDDLQAGIQLPEEFNILTDPQSPGEGAFWDYLLNTRGLSKYEVMMHNIGYCRRGMYQWRIIIPVRSNGVLWTFVARAIHGSLYPKILHPKGASPSHALFGLDLAQPDYLQGHIILVKGAFDAIKLGSISCATLGTNISAYQRDLLKAKRVETITLLWDSDTAGRAGASKVLEPLLVAGFGVNWARLPEGQDPDSSSYEELEQALNNLHDVEMTPTGPSPRPDRLDTLKFPS